MWCLSLIWFVNLFLQGSFPKSGFTFKVYYPSNRTIEDRWVSLFSPCKVIRITTVSTITNVHTNRLSSYVFTANFKDSKEDCGFRTGCVSVVLYIAPCMIVIVILKMDLQSSDCSVLFSLYPSVFFVMNNKGFILCTEHSAILLCPQVNNLPWIYCVCVCVCVYTNKLSLSLM